MKKKKENLNMKVQWTKFAVVTALYLLFLLWLKSWLGIIVIPFIYDAYISKKINWQWWKTAEGPTRFIMSWVDAIVFALVAVYFINQFFFQNYVIPSSSLEKSLLTGDYLFVSKVSYGPRIPETPLTMPLTQHTLPVVNCKSYIEWPHWQYRRAAGLGKVRLNDIVVFNYPAGDTLVSEPRYQAADFYRDICYPLGIQLQEEHPDVAAMSKQQQYDYMRRMYAAGKAYVEQNATEFGHIMSRPTDRRENYVKRCVGLPGQTLQIKNKIIYLDGKANKEPDQAQYTYDVQLNGISPVDLLTDAYDDLRKELGISAEDITSLNQYGYMPMTKATYNALKKRTDLVSSIKPTEELRGDLLYPLNAVTGWTRDNYGPVWIPAKGKSIRLTMDNIALYERPIRSYEHNDLVVKGGKIYINGKQTDTYTFKMDYYWMMGDNRHNSADSRYWGFVPEDHVVGKPIFVWWSSDPDRHGFSGIRWSRLFSIVDNIK